MVTFLDLGFHKSKQEEFDGEIKDLEKNHQQTSKNWVLSLVCNTRNTTFFHVFFQGESQNQKKTTYALCIYY